MGILYDRDRLERHFQEHGCVADFFYSETVDSTNLWARRVFPCSHRSLFLANTQTAGRGRFGRRWVSPIGVGIYMSIAMDSRPLPAAGVFWNFAAAWAVVQALGPLDPPVECKWPNDLWMADRKVGGILVELLYQGPRAQGLVVGIGLNVHATSWPIELTPSPISLEEATGRTWDRTALVIAIVDALVEADRAWQRDRGARLLRTWFQTVRWQPGHRIRIRVGNRFRDVVIIGVESDGSLRVVDPETTEAVQLSIYEVLGLTRKPNH